MASPVHFLTIADTPEELLRRMLIRAIRLRGRPGHGLLAGKTLLCLFEKPSLRTRVSFEQAMRKLGGEVMSMTGGEVGIGGREAPQDIARVLSSMVDGVMARVMLHDTLETFASVSTVPIINGLSNWAHPAQAIADILTIIDEFSPGNLDGVRGRTVAFVGDGNNVARSLAAACAKLGLRFNICSPPGYEFDRAWVKKIESMCPGCVISQMADPVEAVRSADAIYCDTFISMGQEHERAERLNAFSRYQVNEELLSRAPGHAIVLHCLPASRGVEITDGVLDGPRSRVFPQARNRMDAQMGLLAEVLG
ncbi:MAG: ornithine carbamoyltransferase [Phycisphaerales bacterium]|nr:ornithine carbamoyltransferase [Phycisphaerales bacterium]